MNALPRLPLPDAPAHDESVGHEIEFRYRPMGAVTAVVFNEDGLKVDEVHSHSFREAYDDVRALYPQAAWDGLDEQEDEDVKD